MDPVQFLSVLTTRCLQPLAADSGSNPYFLSSLSHHCPRALLPLYLHLLDPSLPLSVPLPRALVLKESRERTHFLLYLQFTEREFQSVEHTALSVSRLEEAPQVILKYTFLKRRVLGLEHLSCAPFLPGAYWNQHPSS